MAFENVNGHYQYVNPGDNAAAILHQAQSLKDRPDVVASLMSSDIGPDFATSVAGIERGKRFAELLPNLPDELEVATWNKMSRGEQQMALGAGYDNGPIQRAEEAIRAAQTKHSGYEDPTGQAVLGAMDFAGDKAKAAGDALVVEPAKKILGAFGWVLHQTDHLYRTSKIGATESNPDDSRFVQFTSGGANLVGGILSGDFGRWWDEADARNAPVDQKVEKSAREIYGNDMIDLIRQEQKGHSLIEWRNYMIASGQMDEAEQLDTVLRSPEFNDARKKMGQALLSPGRQLALGLGIEDNHAAFNVVSGLSDGAYRVLTDPFLTAGAGLKAYQIGKYGLPKDTAVLDKHIDRLFDPTRKGGENVRRYFDQAGAHLETIRTADRSSASIGEAKLALSRNFKELNPAMIETMLKHNVKDADSAHDFFKTSAGFIALTKGEAAFRRPLMPYRTEMGEKILKMKPGSVIDWLEQGHKITRDEMSDLSARVASGDVLAAKELGQAFRGDSTSWRGRSATAMRRMSTKIPELGQAGHGFDVMKPGASGEFEKMARMFGPKDWSKQVSATFAAADEAGRKQMTVGLYLTMFESAGVGKTAAGAEWLRDFRKMMTGEGSPSIYGVTGASALDGSGRPVAWRLEDARPYLPVPSFQEMYAQAAKLGVADRLFGGVNRAWVDYYTTNIWKPSVLIRPALALRNAGEEIVNAMVRNPVGYLNDHAARITLNRRIQQMSPAERANLGVMDNAFDPEAARMFRVATWASKALTKPLAATGQKHLVALSRALEKAPVTAHDFYRQRAYGYLSEKYLKALHPDHLRYIDELATDPWMQQQYRLHILEESTRGASGAMGQDILELKRNGKVGKYRYTQMAGHDLVSATDDIGAQSWSLEALKTADDPAGLQALLHIDDETAAIAAITKVIEENPEYARRMVKAKEDGAEALAKVVYAETRALFSGANGQLIEPLIAAYRQTNAAGARFVDHEMLTPAVLNMVPNELRPALVLGSKNRILMEDNPNLIQRVVQGSFKELGALTAYLSRQSQFTGGYIEGRKLLAPAEGALRAEYERAFAVPKVEGHLPESVVRGENGELLRVYHGTGSTFDEFGQEFADAAGWFGRGHYFTENPLYAGTYAGGVAPNVRMAHLDMKKVWNWDADRISMGEARGLIQKVWGPEASEEILRSFRINDRVLPPHVIESIRSGHLGEDSVTLAWVKAHLMEDIGIGGAEAQKWAGAVTDLLKNKGYQGAKFEEYVPGPELRRQRDVLSGLEYGQAKTGTSYVVFDSKNVHAPYSPSGESQPMILTGDMSARAARLASEQVKKDALEIAISKTIKYMDNPAIRSQASVLMRNVAPFYRAQEEFLARWARTFKYSPEAFERGLLMLNGVTQSGIVHKDDQGRYLLTYPATGALQKAISKMPFMGMAMLPVSNTLTGNLMMMTPGTNIDSQLHPLNGPVLTIPVAAARQMTGDNPAFVGVERSLFGEAGAGRNVFLNQVPSAIKPIVENMARSDELISQTAIQSFAMLEATGHGLKHEVTKEEAAAFMQANPGATREQAAEWLKNASSGANSTPEEQQAYLERLRMHAKSFIWMKAILKPFLPAAPSQDQPAPAANPSAQAEGLRSVRDEFRSLLKDMSPDQAFEYWTKAHPDEMPFTVGTTDPTGAATIPSTAIAGEFIAGNRSFLGKYQKAGVFLIPQGRGEFDEESWRTAMDMGLREKKDLEPYMKDVLISGGLKTYFDSKDRYEAQLRAADDAGNTRLKTALRDSWSKWRQNFYSWNPLVDNFLAAGGPRDAERKDTLDQMRRMMSDPSAPQVPGLEKLRTMVESYDRFDSQLSAVKGTDDRSQAYKQGLHESFEKWMKDYVAGDPGAEMLYNKLFRYMNG